MKSKNYTAAEKHFNKLETGLRLQLKRAQTMAEELLGLLEKSNIELEALKEQNVTLKVEREEMLKLLELSEADFKKLKEKLSSEKFATRDVNCFC